MAEPGVSDDKRDRVLKGDEIVPLNFISVKEASERYGYSGSHIRNLLGKGMIEGEKFAGVWLVDPGSMEKHRTRMEELGNKKHGVWANASDGSSSVSLDRQG